MTVDSHAEELASDLGADKTEVKRDLENLLEYSVPLDEAIQSLRRKYGDDDRDTGGPSAVSISEITPSSGNVTVTARVLTMGTRSVRYQDEEQVVREGTLADESDTISYTAWDEVAFEPGDTVTIDNANVREWNGRPELNLGQHSGVTIESEALAVPYDIGGDTELRDLEPGDRGRNIEVIVTDVEQRTIDGRDGRTDILSGIVADETSRLPFTDWDPHPEIEADATLRIENVYIREFRGAPTVNVSEFSTIEPISRSIQAADPPKVSIREAIETGGAFDIIVEGSVVGIRDGSGLIQRCPECGRVIQKGQCRSHGTVDGEDDLRVKAIIDDGTSAVTAVLDADLTEDIYGGDITDARAAAREAMDQSVVSDEIERQIVGREYEIRGTLSVDEYGANLDASRFSPSTVDADAQARRVLEAYER